MNVFHFIVETTSTQRRSLKLGKQLKKEALLRLSVKSVWVKKYQNMPMFFGMFRRLGFKNKGCKIKQTVDRAKAVLRGSSIVAQLVGWMCWCLSLPVPNLMPSW